MKIDANQQILFVNGRFYTLDDTRPWVEALAVQGGVITAMGTTSDILKMADHQGQIVDLDGCMVMPGIHDAHLHLLMSGLKFGVEGRISANATPGQVVDDLNEYLKSRSGKLGDWIVGGEVNPYMFAEGELDRRFLDERFPDRPVYLFDYSIHHALVNSKSLELAGIDRATPEPFGGRIVRRTGSEEPTGELVERARWAVSAVMPAYEPDVYLQALRWSIQMAHRFGITSVQEASASLPELQALKTLDENDDLKLHVAAHLVWQEVTFSGGLSLEEQEQLISRREHFKSRHVDTRFVKCWLDGAPLGPHFTQVGLMPDNRVDERNLLISEDQLSEVLAEFDRQGITLKIHCAGEGAVRIALNAVARTRAKNGANGTLHEIAHAGFVHPDDRPRFAQLGVVAEMSPALWHHKAPEFEVLKAGFKFNTMHRMGAHVTIGSDWIITADPNPFPPLQGMLEHGEEAVDLPTALKMMILDGARAVGHEDRYGSLVVGKSADFIVLDRNLFEVPVSAVGETQVLRTVFEGKTVYRADIH